MPYLSMESLYGHSSFFTFAAGAVALFVAVRVCQALNTNWRLRHIPTVGPSGILSSYSGAIRFLKDARGMIQEGYEKYHGNAFKIPLMTQWAVIISGQGRVQELGKAPPDVVSFKESLNEILQRKYTLGHDIAEDKYVAPTVGTTLNRNIGVQFHNVQDELKAAFADHMPATEDWSKVQVLDATMQITSRTSNRFYVGLPICRDPDYRKLTIDFTVELVKTATIIGLFPEVLKPLVARCLTSVPKCIDQAIKHLGPLIQDRLDKDAKYGMDWEGRPNDLISWFLEIVQGPQREVRNLVLRVLTVNFGSIHSTSITFTQIIFDLAKHSEYIPALREEIEAVVRKEGLTKASLAKMVKVDSFIKESQRFGGLGPVAMPRKLLQDFKFSDGLVLPKGTYVLVANGAMHVDEAYFADPATFDGYRFLKMAETTGDFKKHSMVALGTDYIVFGNGRHACPGRFFAVNEIKAFIVHLLMNYDIMLDPGAPPFKNLMLSAFAIPDPSACILIRQRKPTF